MKRNWIGILLAVLLVLAAVAVIPRAQAAEADIALLYDDRKELSTLVEATGDVVISDEAVTSYQVGSTEKDEHVLVYEDGVLYAVGTGTATLTVGEKSYHVTVSPAPISLFMITGHSIGAGQEGNGSQSVVVEAGQAYSSFHQNSLDVTEVDGYGLGWGSENRVGGVEGLVRTGWDSYGHIDAFAPGMGGSTGSGSGFAYAWNQATGEKVWVINIAIGGSCINEWLPGAQGHNTAYDLNYYDQTVSKFTYAQTILKNEAAAGHYSLSKQGILNFPGYNFTWYPNWSVESLQENYETLWNAYTEDLTTVDIDGDGENDGLDILAFTVAWKNGTNTYDRPLAWYMGTSAEYPMVIASAATLQWRATGGLASFPAIDYTTQSVAVAMPESEYHSDQGGTSTNSLLCEDDKTHYSQVGYNAIGIDMAKNLAAWFEATPTATSVRLEDYSSSDVGGTLNITVGESFQMTPVVSPVTVSDLTYEVTGAAELSYPLAVKGTAVGTATLTVKQGSTVLRTVTFNVSEAHSHCECGDTAGDTVGHTCGEAITYVPLTKDCFTSWRYTNSSGASTSETTVLREGNYYLDGNYSHSGSIFIAPGQTVNICLNGYKLTTSDRSFKPNGNLNICDCSEHGTGSVYANTTTNAPILYGYSGNVVNIYGGNYSSKESTVREFAGCIASANDLGLQNCDLNGDGTLDNTAKGTGELNIFGGTFYGDDLTCKDGSPTASGRGGCIYVVTTSCTFNLYGGTLIGGSAVPYEDGGKGGGGVIGNSGTVNLYGGTITGSTDPMGAVYSYSSTSVLTVSGDVVFENNAVSDIYLAYGATMTTNGLGENVSIVLDSTDIGSVIVTLSSEAEAAQFSAASGYGLSVAGTSLSLTRDNTYCECGGTISDSVKALSGHTCTDATWTPLRQTNQSTYFSTSSSKYYPKSTEIWLYLTSDVNLSYPIEIKDGYSVHIDLNGHTLTHSSGSNAMLRVYGSLTVCDTSEAGTGEVVGVRTGTGEAPCVYLLNYASSTGYSPEFHFYSGTLRAFNITSNTDRTRTIATQSGVVQVGNNKYNKLAAFYMYGGTIRDGQALTGGNVYLGHGTMNLYGGLIENGTATSTYGGNVRVGGDNTFNMYGGTITGGTANTGGNMYFATGGTAQILGGEILNGLSTKNGGNIYLLGGTMAISKATLYGGCGLEGGNLYASAGTVTVDDCLITDGKAGFAFTRNADGTVAYKNDGSSSGNAGNIYVSNAIVTVTDSFIQNGISCGKNGSNGFGGNMYNKGTLSLDRCTVSGGSCFRGGVVGIRDNGTQGASITELRNCTFYDNSASVAGSSVGLWADSNGADIIIENCTFDDSAVNTRHGVISIVQAGAEGEITVTAKDISIENDNAAQGGSYAIYTNCGELTLDGTGVFNADDADIYMTGGSLCVTEEFQTAEPITVSTTFMGQIGTSGTDKSDCFTAQTLGVTWDAGILSINGLLQGANSTYKTVAQAQAAGETELTLLEDHVGDLEITDSLYLNLNGFTLTGDITGSGTLYGMDSATDAYTTDNMGRITGTVSCEVATHFKHETSLKRYMAIADETGYTFHRFYLGITQASLRPGTKGVGYKAVFAGSPAVAEHIDAFGYRLQLGSNSPLAQEKDGAEFVSMKTVTLRIDNFDADNWGTTDLSAQVYLVIDGETVTSAACTYSLQEMIETVNTNAASYTASQITALAAWIAESDTMKSWQVENLYTA